MPKISNSVVRRLPRYYRFLGELLDEGLTKISSRELSVRMKLTASQIRQDFNCFGGFGQQGYGYNVAELRKSIGRVIGIDQQHKVIILGAGNMGRAIAVHLVFEKCGCNLTGIFDIDRKLEGTEIGGCVVQHTDKLADFCKENKPEIAVLCIPKENAKEMCDKLIALGINAFWNFSHFDINLAYNDLMVENVHLSDSLLTLSYGLNSSTKSNEAGKE